MSSKKYRVLRCQSIAELEDRINDYEAKGWARTGRRDFFDGMHVHTICIVSEADDTEDITTPLD